ncbi:MAG TPA: right-handed parallel beta-helix repeat-containing protein [Candidatus Limnocylindrales bacterium]
MESVSRRAALRAGVVTTALVGGAVAAAPSPAAASVEPGWVSVLDHGAVGDGVTDDTAAIRAAVAAAAASSPHRSISFPAGHTFKVSDGITVTGLSDFVISGYGATLALAGGLPSANGSRTMLRLVDCRRFKVLGLSLHDRDRVQSYTGLGMTGCTSGVIDGVTVREVRFNGIIVFDGVPGRSRDLTITNCTTEGTRFGISTNGTDVRIVDNHVAMYWPSTAEAAAKGGVWSAPSDYYDGICVWAGGDRTVISGNTVTECGQAGVYTEAVTNLVVADNTVTGCQLRGIEIDGTKAVDGTPTGRAYGVSITGNVVTNCIGHINLVRAQDVTVAANRIENPNPARAVSCIAVNTGTTNTVAVGNHVRQAHASFPAVYVTGAATGISLTWNAVDAAVPYQAPAEAVIIHRGGPGQIKTTGKIIAGGGIGVGNSAVANNLGSVVRRIEVFSSTGASLGYIPVYNSIT